MIGYTSEARVREISGLNNTTNIPPSLVGNKMTYAESMVNSAIGARYLLPLAYHLQNSITFSGTGSGSGSMVVTINGTPHTINIASLTTAQSCADHLRAVSDPGFYFDLADSGTQVTVYSNASSVNASGLATANTQVTISVGISPVAGITATISTITKRYCSVVNLLTADTAAALLLFDQYGVEGQNTGLDGDKRLQMVSALQKRMQQQVDDGPLAGPMIRLTDDVTQQELAQNSLLNAVSFPNTLSNTDPNNPTYPYVNINMKF